MCLRIIAFLLIITPYLSWGQSDTSDYEYEVPVLDSTKIHRFGFILGGGVQQFRLEESTDQMGDSLHRWNSSVRPMYKVGIMYHRKLNQGFSFQTGVIVSNSFYRLSFYDGQSFRSDTNGYSQLDIPFDIRIGVYKSMHVSLGAQYHVDITKSLLKEGRLFDLKQQSLSVKGAIGNRFVLGGKYFQVDVFMQYAITNILNRTSRYDKGLNYIHPYQIGLRMAFY